MLGILQGKSTKKREFYRMGLYVVEIPYKDPSIIRTYRDQSVSLCLLDWSLYLYLYCKWIGLGTEVNLTRDPTNQSIYYLYLCLIGSFPVHSNIPCKTYIESDPRVWYPEESPQEKNHKRSISTFL